MKYIYTTLLAVPLVTFAAPSNFTELVAVILEIVESLLSLLFAVTFIVIIWGVTKAWVLNPGDEQKIESGRQIALAGVIGLSVMVSVWGIVKLLKSGLV